MQGTGTATLSLKNNITIAPVLVDVSATFAPCAKDKPVWSLTGVSGVSTGIIAAEGIQFSNIDLSLSLGNCFLQFSLSTNCSVTAANATAWVGHLSPVSQIEVVCAATI